MATVKQKLAAEKFAKDWEGKGYERGQSQTFWLMLLNKVFGVPDPDSFISFEDKVVLDHTSFIDGRIRETQVLIEQKSRDKNLKSPIRQSDGSMLTPFEQAKRYIINLPRSEHPRWVVLCNFQEFHVYDMEHPEIKEPEVILLKNLGKEYSRLQFLVDSENDRVSKEEDISLQAGELVGRIYDALLKQYHNPKDPHALKSLNMLCVRLVFCMYAEDAGIFPYASQFTDYLKAYRAEDAREALINLFKVLDTKIEERSPYLKDSLKEFPYVNGGLFEDEEIEIPMFTEDIMSLLLQNASSDFDWSGINPTIFGAVFESTLNQETRRSNGMHYTSIENIHKVIDPLFLDSLREEADRIRNVSNKESRKKYFSDFRRKLGELRFLDPACGSGNFLTETYLSLRRLENEILKETFAGQMVFDVDGVINVHIDQFYGIELNDFAVNVAKTALWIAEFQMMKETEKIVQVDLDFLPLKSYTNIVEGNALRMDWEEVVPKDKLSYILGNPPFVGARLMSKEQKEEMLSVFGKLKGAGNLDYVTAWYKKAAKYMAGTKIQTAFVSTNSITQGEQPAILWRSLYEEGEANINFGYRTFKWNNETKGCAAVHCVIVGFTLNQDDSRIKWIFKENGERKATSNVNAYLVDAPNILIESRTKPLCDVPSIGIGNKPIDGGNYLFTEDEMISFIRKEPLSEKWFRPWVGSDEFINGKRRYCLWLGDCPPNELRKMPEAIKRVEAVKKFRGESKSQQTRVIASKPRRFHVENMPKGDYIVLPKVSSERREYVPMGLMTPHTLSSDLVFVISNATLYLLGVLTSGIHMAWMRAVCGRLEMRYRYSKDIVYNNFPFPTPTDAQKEAIEKTAQGILDARALYPDSSLADLYDPLTMPPELRKAHEANDRAVEKAYGRKFADEAEIVAYLMQEYQRLVSEKK